MGCSSAVQALDPNRVSGATAGRLYNWAGKMAEKAGRFCCEIVRGSGWRLQNSRK